jgi:hypothetical protein
MWNKKVYWISAGIVLIGAVLVLIPILTAFTAANTVPTTRADINRLGLDPNQLAPPECAGMGLTNIVLIGAGETGTDANDLILGTDKNDAEIRGGKGNDCILGGKGNERQKIDNVWSPGLYGDEGDDVLIGGPGNNDYCDGGDGSDSYYSCEITY